MSRVTIQSLLCQATLAIAYIRRYVAIFCCFTLCISWMFASTMFASTPARTLVTTSGTR
jgi:hypothetical protein